MRILRGSSAVAFATSAAVAVLSLAGAPSTCTAESAASLRGASLSTAADNTQATLAQADDWHHNDDSPPFDPPFDHQTTAYTAHFRPMAAQQTVGSVAAFFSPDSSIQTLTQLVQDTPSGGTFDIGEPGWDSWIGCTYIQSEGNCVGCTIEAIKQETFPLFPAVLNAVHRGVKVRLLTNDYSTATCPGQIAPLDYLALNGVDIKFYRTTTFWHAKYMNQNKNQTAISSVNFSKASLMKNREAGLLLTGPGTQAHRQFAASVFESDWENGYDYVVNQTYTQQQMREITNPNEMSVSVPTPPDFPGTYITPAPKYVTASMQLGIYTSPDFARPQLFADMDSADRSFELYIYQITDPGLCSKLIDMHKSGINVSILVSKRIYSYHDHESARVCYEKMWDAYLKVRVTSEAYEFSHQKYWIVNGKRLGLSTGNWSPTDFPDKATDDHVYPPYGEPNWQDVNRDFQVAVEEPELVGIFQKTFVEDSQRGRWWTPYSAGIANQVTV